jgi:voltage-dependent potassium channel beta subunit
MRAAYDAGVNFFDNAEAYAGGQSERLMGEALRSLGWRRGSYLVSTKLFWGLHDNPNEKNTLNRKYLLEGIAGSLLRLGLDYVDLLYCHRPDPHTPISEIVWAMHDIISRGQALYWGTSEWSAQQVTEACEFALRHHLRPPVVEQPEYNLFRRARVEREYAPLYEKFGIGTTTWSPLASGLLTGKYLSGVPVGSRFSLSGMEWLKERYLDESHLNAVRDLNNLAQELGVSLARLAIAWCASNPHVTSVILGATSEQQLRENLGSVSATEKIDSVCRTRIEAILNRYGFNS